MNLEKVIVVGASGYSGEELVRLLIRHPCVDIVALTSRQLAGQTVAQVFPRFARMRQIHAVFDDRLFYDAERHNLESWHRLQLRVVSHREPAAIRRRLIALVEERCDRHLVELRERIVDHGLVAHIRKDQAATGSTGQHHARKHGGEKNDAGSVPIFRSGKMGTDPFDATMY